MIEVGKEWWQSKTMWAGIVAILTGIGNMFGVAVPEDQLLSLIMAIVGMLAGVVTVAGRATATTKIKPAKIPGVAKKILGEHQ